MEIRPATLDDVDRLAAFMGRCTLAHQGVRRASADEMRQRLTKPGTDPALDTWLVEDDDEVVGFAQVWPEEEAVVCYVRVDPGAHRPRDRQHAPRAHSGTRARAQSRASLHATSWPKDESAAPLLEGAGFQPIRYLSLMTIDLDAAAASELADRRGVRALDEGTDLEPIHELVQEIFPERRADFDRVAARVQGGFDPRSGSSPRTRTESPASRSVCQSSPRIAGRATSASSAFGPTGAAQGLGLALLQHTFVEFHGRGRQRVSLHVDVDNLTGALRLYTHAGMRPDPRLVIWERPRQARREVPYPGPRERRPVIRRWIVPVLTTAFAAAHWFSGWAPRRRRGRPTDAYGAARIARSSQSPGGGSPTRRSTR